jgi:hypothetical protein
MTTTSPSLMEFDTTDLFADAVAPAEPTTSESYEGTGDQVDASDAGESDEETDSDVDPDAATVLADEDDGPQPGDDLDDEPSEEDGSIANAMVAVDAPQAASGGISQAENALVEIQNAELKCIRAESAVDDLKEQLKEAKAHYDGCVDRLRKLARATTLDASRPLLAAAEAVNAEEATRIEPAEAATDASDDDEVMFDDDEIAANLTSDAVNEHLALRPGQLRIRLLKEVVNEHPDRGTLTWAKGVVVIACLDNTGTTYIPFEDDQTDGTGLDEKEFAIVEEPPVVDIGQEDSRFSQPLSNTPISMPTVKLLAAAGITTVRQFEDWRKNDYEPKVDKLGQGKIEKAEAAMVDFWAK